MLTEKEIVRMKKVRGQDILRNGSDKDAVKRGRKKYTKKKKIKICHKCQENEVRLRERSASREL